MTCIQEQAETRSVNITEIRHWSALVEPEAKLTYKYHTGLQYANMRCSRDAEHCLRDLRRDESLVTVHQFTNGITTLYYSLSYRFLPIASLFTKRIIANKDPNVPCTLVPISSLYTSTSLGRVK